MDLVEAFTFRAALKPPLAIGAGPIGTRMVYEVTGGEGRLLPALGVEYRVWRPV